MIRVPPILLFALLALNTSVLLAQDNPRITIIVDAFSERDDVRLDWGFAALVEYRGTRILFDAGNDADVLAENARALGIDLTRLDAVVISHRHGDHANGLRHVLSINPDVPIYAPAGDEYFGTTTSPAYFERTRPEGTVISGDGTSYVLVETDREGRVLARFGRNVPLDPIPAAERRDSIAALKARLDSIPVGLDRVGGMPEAVRKLDVPRRYPAYMAVYVTNDGGVWVRRWPIGGGNRTIFDVFARTGEFRRTVVLPHSIMVEPTPYLSGDVVVGVARDPVTDESIILRFEKDASG